MCMCLPVWGLCRWVQCLQKPGEVYKGSLELELHAIVSHLTRTLGNIFRSSVRAVCAFEPSLQLMLKYFYDASFKSPFLIVKYLITSVLMSFDCHQVWGFLFLVILKKNHYFDILVVTEIGSLFLMLFW